MNLRKEATYRMLSLIAAVMFVLPCVVLVFPIFDINPDDLWQMDSLVEFICAYKNTAILAIVGVLIQIVIALPAGYAIARIPSPKAQTFFLLTCVFFLLLPQQALMLPQYLVLMNIGWLDSLKGLLIMTAFQPWMILLFWFAAKRIDSSLFDSAICDGASNWGLFRCIGFIGPALRSPACPHPPGSRPAAWQAGSCWHYVTRYARCRAPRTSTGRPCRSFPARY